MLAAALVLLAVRWLAAGSAFASRHAFFGGRGLDPVAGSITYTAGTQADGWQSTGILDAATGAQGRLRRIHPAWPPPVRSPDGTRFAYLQNTGTVASVQVEPAPPVGDVRVHPAGLAGSAPATLAWSPDGRRIAYIGSADPRTGFETLHVVPASGGTGEDLGPAPIPNRTCLTVKSYTTCKPGRTGEVTALAWLPGGRLAYVVRVSASLLVPPSQQLSRIYVRPATSSGAATLLAQVPGSGGEMVVSPDQRFLFYGFDGGDARPGHLWPLRGDGAGPAVVLPPGAAHPAWSADGRRLLLVHQGQIMTAAAGGRGARTLGHMPPRRRHPSDVREAGEPMWFEIAAWSPDARHIVVAGSEPDRYRGGYSVRVMNADGTGQTVVGEVDGQVVDLGWVR